MNSDDDLPAPKPPHAGLPRPLDRLGIAELEAYVAELRAEIARAEAEIGRKRGMAAAAHSFFKTT